MNISNTMLLEKLYEKGISSLNVEEIIECYRLYPNIIIKFQDRLDWEAISSYTKLSEEFIVKFQDRVYWEYISRYQKLSEKLIIKFKNKVDWCLMAQCQNLSKQFIMKHCIRFGLENLSLNNIKKLSYETLNKYDCFKLHRIDYFSKDIWFVMLEYIF